jgi:hypothetical protein
MTPLEVFAILVLAGAVVVLLYFYMQDNRNLNLGRVRDNATNLGDKVSGEGSMSGVGEKINVSGVSEKVSGVGEKIHVSGVSEKMSGMGERLRGKVNVPISTDTLTSRLDLFLNEQSDQLIEDWDLATKKDLSELEKRFNVVSLDFDALEKRFSEYRGATNSKLESIEKRLEKLETSEITTEKIKK